MSLNAIFDPMVRAFFDDNDVGGADTGDLGIFTIPKSAIDQSKTYEIEGIRFYKASVAIPTDDWSKGVLVFFDANYSAGNNENGLAEIFGLWNDEYSYSEEIGVGMIVLGEIAHIIWFTNSEIAQSQFGAETGVYVSGAFSLFNCAVLYPKA